MSQENVEIVRRHMVAFESGNYDAARFLNRQFCVRTLPSGVGYFVATSQLAPLDRNTVDDESAPLMLATPRGL